MSKKSEKIHGDFSIKDASTFFGIDLLFLNIKRWSIEFRKISHLRGGPEELKHSALPTPWDFYY